MNIIVCVKQVPDVDDIKWTKENNLDRMSMLSKLNPHDEWALDWGLNIKSNFKDASLTVLSMGPNQAKEILYYALAKGADRAILLSDKAFSGSDTLITARIIAKAINKFCADYNLIITGQLASDGDTQQVPVSLAQELDIIDAINVIEIYNADKNKAIVSQKIDNEINVIEMQTPCLIAVSQECTQKFIPKIEDYIRSQNTQIETFGIEELDLDKTAVGVIGSPTLVYRAFRPVINKKAVEIEENYTQKIIDILQGEK